MDPLLLLLIMVGALTVLIALVAVVVGIRSGFDRPAARILLRVAGGGGLLCAVLGAMLAVFSG
ncbi:hypothetical protein [Brachybacterium hainanense]|uniref:Uncharacterized protein n=1 Tax=Brachybacterium hainanense TaxID=1541174 RepID=A0ABV6RCA1_9MICO